MGKNEYGVGTYRELFSLKGKTAIITGGAGALGSVIAAGLAEFGANLILMGRTKSTLEAAADQVARGDAQIFAITGDCTNEKDCQRIAIKTINTFGGVDILVNAAAMTRRYPAEGFPPDYFRDILNTNVQGAFLMCKAVGQHMIRRGGGRIINLSSIRAVKGHPLGYAANASASGAVNALTRQMATEWAKYTINVNCISVVEVETPATKDIFEDAEKSKIFTDRIPFGRVAQPEDLIGTAVYLASNASGFLTGQIICVDGGCTAS